MLTMVVHNVSLRLLKVKYSCSENPRPALLKIVQQLPVWIIFVREDSNKITFGGYNFLENRRSERHT